MLIGGLKDDFAVLGGRRLGGVLDQVEECLNQLVPVAENRRQRWVEIGDIA